MRHEKGIYFPDRENLAREINNIICYYDLSAELIADEIFNNKENDASISAAIIDVIAERQRQITGEGFTPEQDDEYYRAELVYAALSYISVAVLFKDKDPDSYRECCAPASWPWSPEWWKPTNPRRDMIKGIALLLAEAERQDRLNGQGVSA
ncbi:TPA: ead/Ea22-like family protein [Salmonella enterica subsp. diarizonae]|nr:ead/Ea22-like family protein [Salmonella enterica subsp. diarizonae]